MWRPDIGKYTGHMQTDAPADALVIKDAVGNVIPQFAPATARMLGPGMRNWQIDPFNKDATYWALGFDSVSCTSALTNAVGAAWATKPGPLTQGLGVSIPILEGVAPTNQIMSTDCGDRCAWLQKDMQATALVGALACTGAAWGRMQWGGGTCVLSVHGGCMGAHGGCMGPHGGTWRLHGACMGVHDGCMGAQFGCVQLHGAAWRLHGAAACLGHAAWHPAAHHGSDHTR